MMTTNAAYLFTGQGPQTTGVGQEWRRAFPAAAAVWEHADLHCARALGFSLETIVTRNPHALDTAATVDHPTTRHWTHPHGLLHCTPFTQVVLVTAALAQVAVLHTLGRFDASATMAGHSLGEFAALAALDVLSLPTALSLVWERGCLMEACVARDPDGTSPFGMLIVSPQAIGWSEVELQRLLPTLTAPPELPLAIANYNCRDAQYAVVGTRSALRRLQGTLVAREPIAPTAEACRWLATIDIPFHSPILHAGAHHFRRSLDRRLPARIDGARLARQYLPNLTGRPFEPTADPRAALIEILARQFAAPVQWIATQETLLELAPRTVCEIGPRPVLLPLLRRTLRGRTGWQGPALPGRAANPEDLRSAPTIALSHVETWLNAAASSAGTATPPLPTTEAIHAAA